MIDWLRRSPAPPAITAKSDGLAQPTMLQHELVARDSGANIGRAIVNHYADYFDPWTYDEQGRRVIDTPAAYTPNKFGKLPVTEKPWWWPLVGGIDIGSNFITPGAGAAGKVAMAAASIGGRGGRIGRLAMDQVARLARAKEMGFWTNMPLAHGTAADFRAFDLSKRGATSGAAPAELGVWTEVRKADSSPIADEFAERAARKTGNRPSVLSLLHRADNPAELILTGRETNDQISWTLAKAWDDGYDAVALRNYTSPGGKKGDILVVKDPAQLRAPTAKFDPAKREKNDLLAGFGGVGLTGLGVGTTQERGEE